MKYEFTGETKEFLSGTLHQIKAVADFGDVKAGDLGGWIEKEENLSQAGDCWVDGNARVDGNALVCGDARVCDNARVWGNAQVYGDAQVWGDALVWGNARVCGDARVWGTNHVLWISPVGSRDDTVTFMRTKDHKIAVSVGCFYGDIDEFEKAVAETHGNNEHAQAYKLAIELAKLRIDLKGEEEDE